MVEVSPSITGRIYPGQKLGEYLVQEKLSQGGYGAVYKATNTKLEGREVVIKVMHAPGAAHRELLRKEAKQLVSLRHPSLVQVITYGEEDELQYVVMEFLDAPTLAKVHKTNGGFGTFETVRIAARIAEALEAVHEVGLVHRDLKPDNIMLKLSKDRGRYVDWLKLIDFGLAHQAGRQGAERAGTAPYVAPETIAPELGGVAPATDLYSLGCILFQMLTDQTPFTGDTDEMLEGHLRGPIRRLSSVMRDVHPDMDELIFKLMQKKPKDRPASATDVVKALAKIEQSLVGSQTSVFQLSRAFDDTKKLPPRKATDPLDGAQERSGITLEEQHPSMTLSEHLDDKTQNTTRLKDDPRPAQTQMIRRQRSVAPMVLGVVAVLSVVGAGAWFATRPAEVAPVVEEAPRLVQPVVEVVIDAGVPPAPEVKPPVPGEVKPAVVAAKNTSPEVLPVKTQTRVVQSPAPRTRPADCSSLQAAKAEITQLRERCGKNERCKEAFEDLGDWTSCKGLNTAIDAKKSAYGFQ